MKMQVSTSSQTVKNSTNPPNPNPTKVTKESQYLVLYLEVGVTVSKLHLSKPRVLFNSMDDNVLYGFRHSNALLIGYRLTSARHLILLIVVFEEFDTGDE